MQTAQSARTVRVLGWTIAAAVLVRLVSLGLYPLIDTTEARYAEIARKMVELGDWVTLWYDYGVPFWAKPPLSTWITAASFAQFGVNEFAARIPHFLGGLLIGWLIWDWARPRSDREALISVALLTGSLACFVTAGAVTTDISLAAGTTLAMRGFWLGLHGSEPQRRREKWVLFIGLSIGLLAKGPIALVLAGLPIVVWAVATREIGRAWRELPWLCGVLIVAALTLPWYLLAELRTPGFLEYFFIGEHWRRFTVAGWTGDLYGKAHAFPLGSIWLFAIGACLPWSLLLPLLAIGRAKGLADPQAATDRRRRLYLMLWGLTPCAFFTASGNVLWTYVLPGLPALAMLAAAWLAADIRTRKVELLVTAGLLIMALGATGLIAGMHWTGQWKTTKSLILEYQARKTGGEALVFLGSLPYSASFYSQGKAERVTDVAALAQRLDKEPAFVALAPGQLRELPPDLRARARGEGQYNGYQLFLFAR